MLYREASKVLREIGDVQGLATEVIPVRKALGRISAQSVVSSETVPPFTNSAVDGFALKSEWIQSASAQTPLRFEVKGVLWPGETPRSKTESGVCWEIMTGAPLPLDCDAAVKIEDVLVHRSADAQVEAIEISRPVSKNENLRFAGEDFRAGTGFVEPGEKIRPEHLMAFAALNITALEVYKSPRVVIVSTGKELVEPGSERKPGQIYNSTRPYLVEALRALGAQVDIAPTIPDEPDVFISFMRKLMMHPPDILITTGAVSMGKADFVRPALEKLGGEILFHRVSIRPGKPILFARLSGAESKQPFVIFGLPGNPVSSVVGTRFFIDPYLRALTKRAAEVPMQARLSGDVRKPGELRCFFKAQMQIEKGSAEVMVLQGQPSFMIRPLLQSSVWAVLPEGASDFESGQLIDVYPQDALPFQFQFGAEVPRT